MAYFLSVLGLALILEGIPYFAFPDKMKLWMEQIQKMPDRVLRIFGLAAMAIGLMFIYISLNVLGLN